MAITKDQSIGKMKKSVLQTISSLNPAKRLTGALPILVNMEEYANKILKNFTANVKILVILEQSHHRGTGVSSLSLVSGAVRLSATGRPCATSVLSAINIGGDITVFPGHFCIEP